MGEQGNSLMLYFAFIMNEAESHLVAAGHLLFYK